LIVDRSQIGACLTSALTFAHTQARNNGFVTPPDLPARRSIPHRCSKEEKRPAHE
jgi:hypothetical protein